MQLILKGDSVIKNSAKVKTYLFSLGRKSHRKTAVVIPNDFNTLSCHFGFIFISFISFYFALETKKTSQSETRKRDGRFYKNCVLKGFWWSHEDKMKLKGICCAWSDWLEWVDAMPRFQVINLIMFKFNCRDQKLVIQMLPMWLENLFY